MPFKWVSLQWFPRAPVDAALKCTTTELSCVAWGWCTLKSCCFTSLLLTWRVMSSVGTKRSQRALSTLLPLGYMWHIDMHIGCKHVMIDTDMDTEERYAWVHCEQRWCCSVFSGMKTQTVKETNYRRLCKKKKKKNQCFLVYNQSRHIEVCKSLNYNGWKEINDAKWAGDAIKSY